MTDDNRHIVLCGLGRVGRRVLDLLVRLGERVTVVCIDRPTAWPYDDDSRASFLLGDARDESLLRRAGVATAKSVIVTTNDDLTNVSIALDARRLNADAVIVTRLYDQQQLGAHLESAAGIDRVLSTSALAAPAFVGAALGDGIRGAFDVNGQTCVVEDVPIIDGTSACRQTLGQWSADTRRTAIGVRRGGAWVMGPPADMSLEAGDVVVALHLETTEAPTPVASDGRHHRRVLWRMARLGLAEWWRTLPRALKVAVFGLMAVIVASVALFHWSLGLPVVDALYFVVTIISTVGFGDYNLQAASTGLKLYGVFLMLSGAAMLATLFSIVTDLVLTTRLRDLAVRGCSHLQDHVIVIGLGNIGFRVLRDLVRAGHTVVAVERDATGKFVESARTLAPVVLGNARAGETLQQAGIDGARAVLAVTDDDISNLSIGLVSKQTRPGMRAVLRVFDADLARKFTGRFGVDAVRSVAGESAPTFVCTALRRDVLFAFQIDDEQLVGIFETVPPDGPGVPIGGHVGICWFPLRPGTHGHAA